METITDSITYLLKYVFGYTPTTILLKSDYVEIMESVSSQCSEGKQSLVISASMHPFLIEDLEESGVIVYTIGQNLYELSWGDVYKERQWICDWVRTNTGKNYTINEVLKLSKLDFRDMNLSKIPDEIRLLTKLQTLCYSKNNINYIPSEIERLDKLSYVDLSYNNLNCIPDEIGFLKHLTYLNLSNNNLTSISWELGKLQSLTTLNLSNNNLTSISATLGQLQSLTDLCLSNNRLTSVPMNLGGLTSLIRLNLSNNKLTSIPMELGNLLCLKGLHLNDNNLSSIPRELAQLSSLIILDLSNNNLTSIPCELENKLEQTTIKLFGNLLPRVIFNPKHTSAWVNNTNIDAASLRKIMDRANDTLSVILSHCKTEAEKSNDFYRHNEPLYDDVIKELTARNFTVSDDLHEIGW